MTKWDNPSVKPFTFLVNRAALQTCKAYSVEVGESLATLLEAEMASFNQALINKSSQIIKLREDSWKRVIDEAQSQEKPIEVQVQ